MKTKISKFTCDVCGLNVSVVDTHDKGLMCRDCWLKDRNVGWYRVENCIKNCIEQADENINQNLTRKEYPKND